MMENTKIGDFPDDGLDGLFGSIPIQDDDYCTTIYWLDISEGPTSDSLCLFGKVMKGSSTADFPGCCVVLHNIERVLYLLPISREPNAVDEVIREFEERIAPTYGISSFSCKKATKGYCFELQNVPKISEYAEIRVNARQAEFLPDGFRGATFSRVFGLKNSLIESFMLGLGLKGPCWLCMKNPIRVKSRMLSWCKLQFSCDGLSIYRGEELNTPSLTVTSIHMQTGIFDEREQIIGVGLMTAPRFQVVGSRGGPEDPCSSSTHHIIYNTAHTSWAPITEQSPSYSISHADSELCLFEKLRDELIGAKSDIYVCFDLDFNTLLSRLDNRGMLKGRIVCDLKQHMIDYSEELIAHTDQELKVLLHSSGGIKTFAMWCLNRCKDLFGYLVQAQCIPLAFQLSSITGNSLRGTLAGGRISENNEFLLAHAFHSRGYIVPDRMRSSLKEQPIVPLKGGLVLEPKRGLYENFVILMDFNSLYPSIIQEYNICFSSSGTEQESAKRGVLPEEAARLVNSRKQLKQMIQDPKTKPHMKTQYEYRQKALKLTANSMYGCLGCRHSRFYSNDLASRVSTKGRDILRRAKEIVENMGFEVIYGDTDSLMVDTKSTDIGMAVQLGADIKAAVNRGHRFVELGVDGIYRFMLLIGKKRYAGRRYTICASNDCSLELKGLDTIRKDCSPIAAHISKLLLNELIMTDNGVDEKVDNILGILKNVAAELRTGKVPIEQLIIRRSLSKNPEDYHNPKGLPHVQVALRMNGCGLLPKRFKSGDRIPIVFCDDESGGEAALHPIEFRKKPSACSPNYYISREVYPVVARLCDPLPSFDPTHIAQTMGMELHTGTGTSLRTRRHTAHDTDKIEYERFSFRCKTCHEKIIVDGPLRGKGTGIAFSLEACPACSSSMVPYAAYLYNTLTLFVRNIVARYYRNVLICDDPGCLITERGLRMALVDGQSPCRCGEGYMHKEFDELALYRQLTYLITVFDIENAIEKCDSMEKSYLLKSSDILRYSLYPKMMGIVNKTLDSSGFSSINFEELFIELALPLRTY